MVKLIAALGLALTLAGCAGNVGCGPYGCGVGVSGGTVAPPAYYR